MYADMYHRFSLMVQKISNLFPTLEALQPEKSGMQALCELHWALDKAKSFLHQILHCSRLYLAITSDSVVVKFEKSKDCLNQSLKNLVANVPEALSEELNLLLIELEGITCEVDASGQDAGKKMISLLQREKEAPAFDNLEELDVFDEVAFQLGITSTKTVFAEKKALKQLLEKVRSDEDKKKELIVLYLIYLLRKYVKLKKFMNLEDGSGSFRDASNFCALSPSDRGSEASTSGRDSDLSSELSFSGARQRGSSRYGHSQIPPEEFICPISLQLMSDPVIICSGQTYERVCIEKWFDEGHHTCPKTQQKLDHLGVTPNYCVKGLIMTWCEKHAIPIPSPPSPPTSPIADWRWDLLSGNDQKMRMSTALSSPTDQAMSKLRTNTPKCKLHPMVDECLWSADIAEEKSVSEDMQLVVNQLRSSMLDIQCRAAEEIRFLTKESSAARVHLAQLGCISALVEFLNAAVNDGDETAQITACLALSNVAVNNNRNTGQLVHARCVPFLVKLLSSNAPLTVKDSAILVLWTISCVEENKLRNSLSEAVPFLVNHLVVGSAQGVKDALSTLFNFSAFPGNQLVMVNAGIVPKIVDILSLEDAENRGKSIAILYSISSIEEGRTSIMDAKGCISLLVEILDSGTRKEKEQIAAMLLVVCVNSSHHTQLILEEGIIPSLVMLSVNGSAKGKDKAQKLLLHFRQQRQNETEWHSAPQVSRPSMPSAVVTPSQFSSGKVSNKKTRLGSSSFSIFRRSRSHSFYRC